MFLRVLGVVCVLLVTVAQVHCSTCICYQVGADCRTWDGRPCSPGSGWLQTMLQSMPKEEGTIDDKYCDCCCAAVPCSATICGNPAVCPINLCSARVLEKTGEGSVDDPKYSANVLTAAVKVQRQQHQKMKAKLQLMMERLITAQDAVESSSPAPVPSNPQHYPVYARTYNEEY